MKNQQTNIDYTLILIIILLFTASIFALHTIDPYLPAKYDNQNFLLKQTQWYIIGGILIFLIMLIDYDRLRQVAWVLYGVGITTLLMLFFRFPASIVHEANNAVSWFMLPGIGSVQPGELFKIAHVLIIAHLIFGHNMKYVNRTNKTDLWLFTKIMLVALPPMALIAVQPDLGGALVLASITGAMLLVSGIRWRVILTIFAAAFLVAGLAIAVWFYVPGPLSEFLEETVFNHIQSRFYGWIYPEQYPDSGYQLVLAMLAIGSGKLFGKGVSTMEVYVPEKHTDMIFTAIAEQFGFIGASVVLILFFLLIYRMIHIAIMSNEQFGSFLVTGFIGMFVYQIFQNIGMSIQLLPITGLPLPFLSYGGSSTLTYLIAIGIVLNVHSRTKTYMFE
ncbi:Rod shape-determining protein RodA [Lentibacillus sp. JNUCC-1]|uniref:FtsW/RodA/SpoVE family cell cycle protein n=1 Tax=Lentibacillus sp. JNUCC-1 TaxID=2654513 RepID=UPI0012E7EDF9|nr:FtsW/RodA/SpoVE family cell cycle protein [Lentibacillus sp. JNUCC-1]MUV36504.1 Rod shape-determining protein RodA [Lentibacillus sp. JNUCC-1]